MSARERRWAASIALVAASCSAPFVPFAGRRTEGGAREVASVVLPPMPSISARASAASPTVVRQVLPSGITLCLVEMHDLPSVAVEALARPPADATHAAIGVWGASDRERFRGDGLSVAVGHELFKLGARYDTDVDHGALTFTMSTPSASFPRAFQLMERAMGDDDFNARMVRRTKEGLRAGHFDASEGVDRVWTHAAVRAAGAWTDSAATDRADALDAVDGAMLAHIQRGAREAASLTIDVAGDVHADAVAAAIGSAVAEWNAKPAPTATPTATPTSTTPPAPALAPSATRPALLIDAPGTSQAAVGVVLTATLDAPVEHVTAEGLRELVLRRVRHLLRDERSWTYGVETDENRHHRTVEITVRADVGTEHAAEATRLMVDALKGLQNEVITQANVDVVREAFLDRRETALATAHGVLAWLRLRWWNDIPCDAASTAATATAPLTVESLTALARQLLVPSSFHVIVVGDASALRRGLERSGFDVTGPWR